MRLRVQRVQANGLLLVSYGLRRLAHLVVHPAESRMRFSIVGILGQDLPIDQNGFVGISAKC